MKYECWRSGIAALLGSLALFAVSHAAEAASPMDPGGEVRILNHDVLGALDLHGAGKPLASLAQFRKAARRDALSFVAFGREFRLILQDNAVLLSKAARAGIYPDDAESYKLLKGSLEGQPGSWIRLTLVGDHLQGVIWDGEEMFSIAPTETVVDALVQPADPADGHVIYRLADMMVTPGTMGCGVGAESAMSVSAAFAYEQLVSELEQRAQTEALGASLELELSAVGDGPFVASFGAGSEAALLTRFNIVDGIFSEQVGIQITVTEIQLFQPGDNTLSATEAGALLDQLTDLRDATPALRDTGVTHLFTGTNLDGITVGIAYLGTVCNPRFATGLSEARRNETSDALIAAHEIGHNFGAPHDGDPDEACASTPETFIMAASGTGSDQFSACSVQQMQPAINGASCLSALSAVDVGVIHSPTATTGLVTRTVSQAVRVTNGGTEAAANVSLDIDIPAGLELLTSAPSVGNCAPAAGGLSCSFGTVQPGADASVLLGLRSDTPGSYLLASTTQADGDDTPNNNTATGRVTIQPAVDLGLSFSGGNVNLVQGNTATATLGVTNSNVGPASAVVVTVDAPAGLTITGGNPSSGSCSAVASRLTCQIPSIAAGANASVAVNVSADQSGGYTLLASVSAAEPDLDSSDNTSSKNYNISQQAPAGGGDGSGGGGGTTGPAFLLLAVLALARRRQHG
ncbi:MAG: M12 family metallo-peptidase [Gammaproteobacteria bacterium]